MESKAQERDVGRMIASTVVAMAIHALIPLFWLVCAVFIMPRFLEFEGIRDATLAVVKFSAFMGRHGFVYLFLLALVLAADGAVYHSLLRSSNRTVARLWSLGIVAIEVALSLLLYVPLMNAVTRMEG